MAKWGEEGATNPLCNPSEVTPLPWFTPFPPTQRSSKDEIKCVKASIWLLRSMENYWSKQVILAHFGALWGWGQVAAAPQAREGSGTAQSAGSGTHSGNCWQEVENTKIRGLHPTKVPLDWRFRLCSPRYPKSWFSAHWDPTGTQH